MKSIFLFISLAIFGFSKSQNIKIDTLLTDKISIRAIQLHDGKVWYAGSQSKFGYVNFRNPKDKSQIKLNAKNQEFRVIARFQENFFETVNVGSPAQFYSISAANLKVSELNKMSDSSVFYDCFKVNSINNNGIAISDPYPNGKPNFFITSKNRKLVDDPLRKLPTYEKGEAHFAASNSNVAMHRNKVWIATGGTKARIFKFDWKSPYVWEVYETPFVQGSSSQGIYAIDFADENFGIAVGGDYTKQSENINNIATTKDGGKTWQIQASGQNAGYSTCVKIKPKSKGKEIVALGDQHISYSNDYGKTWTKISDEKGFYTFEWLDSKSLILAGKDRIVKLTFLDY
ncbi:glycosyl hydrolase [Chryseobacterium sp. POL2]|uniref:WD40/YVTN/BNR-like repeat-containing protein n=1 Tax=Chryseobacterium sp. POL2 TaxID=2713414 RepID=UPI0013E0F53C|nr:glycosyl hydrolase [Chryseobacterium sp. POL2]QIG90786.1 glycosyl hydrolase [Chryseobacterium sp. POL2]